MNRVETLDPKALEALARAYDGEDASLRGEPSPWMEEGDSTFEEWREERLDCAQVAIRAYLALSTPIAAGGGEAAREVAWLIERQFVGDHTLWYAENATGFHWWAQDASMAKRFASKAEAEAFPAYRMIARDPAISITEHVFLRAALSTAGAAEPDPSFSDALPDNQIRIWINACNHEPARQALRQLLAYRIRGVSAPLASPPSDTEEKAP